MIQNKTISLVLPCRNEGSHLKEVLNRIPAYVDEILIVSNRSTDNTIKVATKLAESDIRIKVLQEDRVCNGIGYGYAHMTGIAAATGEIIACADGDATYPIEDLKKIISYLYEKGLDFISCNRYPLRENVKIPLKLRLGVGILNQEIRILYGIPIKDALSGMWVFRSSIRDDLRLTMGDWNLSPQIKINAANHKRIKFSEYSIAQHQRLGETKQNYFKTGLSHATWIFKNRFTGS